MQDKKYLATIVPLGPQARKQIQKGENLDVIRAAVWSETAKKLTPLLGSVCSRFLPATYAWSICNYRPFGVMLGGVTADMEDMLLCYTRARLEQMNEIEARQQRLISRGETLLNESPIQSLNITVVSIDSSNMRWTASQNYSISQSALRTVGGSTFCSKPAERTPFCPLRLIWSSNMTFPA